MKFYYKQNNSGFTSLVWTFHLSLGNGFDAGVTV